MNSFISQKHLPIFSILCGWGKRFLDSPLAYNGSITLDAKTQNVAVFQKIKIFGAFVKTQQRTSFSYLV